MNAEKFIDALLTETIIGECCLDFGTECFKGYYLCSSSPHYVVSHLVPQTYLSHASALNIWGLMDHEPSIYVNREQSQTPKVVKGRLEQTAISNAFRRPQRQPEIIADFKGIEVFYLRGRYTGNLGVTAVKLGNKEEVQVTDLERTLIDCIVRPAYAPPPKQMIEVFRKVKKQISVATMAGYLDELNYLYPYHQCLGFYLERAGNYSNGEIRLFSSKDKIYDFYLDYALESPVYNERWRLYYPAILDD